MLVNDDDADGVADCVDHRADGDGDGIDGANGVDAHVDAQAGILREIEERPLVNRLLPVGKKGSKQTIFINLNTLLHIDIFWFSVTFLFTFSHLLNFYPSNEDFAQYENVTRP